MLNDLNPQLKTHDALLVAIGMKSKTLNMVQEPIHGLVLTHPSRLITFTVPLSEHLPLQVSFSF